MAKRVHTASKIVLGGVDVSEYVAAWYVGAAVGDLYMCTLTLLDTPRILDITSPGERVGRDLRVCKDDVIKVGGVDISRWIGAYHRIARAQEADTVELHIHCDSDVLSINGTHPWEMP